MNITLRTPLSFSEIGKKDNQEDRLYPQTGAEASRFFILCDGMGGHERGEVAAEVVSMSLGAYLQVNMPDAVTPAFFRKALGSAYDRLDQALSVTGSRKPGTTLACTCFGTNGVLAAHIGDSRVYQVRPGQGIIFRTTDHSLVSELLKSGEITEAEAANHPNKNVITRAIQPAMKRRSDPEMTLLTDVRSGDYFFICCDGVLECLSDSALVKALSDASLSDADKLAAIKKICDEGGTRDNYTAWLIPVDKVTGQPAGRPVESTPVTAMRSQGPTASKNKTPLYIGIAAIVVIVVAVIAFLLPGGSDSKSSEDVPAVENIQSVGAPEVDAASGAAPVTDTPVSPKKNTGGKQSNKRRKDTPVETPQTPAAQSAQTTTGTNAAAAAAAAMGNGRNEQGKTDPKTEPVPVTEPEEDPAPIN